MAPDTCRLLLLDDDADQRSLVAASLEASLPFGQIDLKSVGDPAAFEEALVGDPADCIITDARLAWTDASEVLRLVRDRWPATAVVLYSGGVSEETAARLMKDGADDFLLKSPGGEQRLPATVEAVVRQRRHHNATVREQADLDALLQTLRTDDDRWRHTFASVPIGLFRTDLHGNLLDANPALGTMLAMPTDGEVPAPLNLVQRLSHFDNQATLLMKLREEGRVADFEAKLVRLDGSHCWVRIDAVVLKDQRGEPLFMEGSLADVTEREEAQRELAVKERHLRAVFERSTVGVTVTRLPSQRISELNSRICAMFGYSRAELLGQPISVLWHPEERDMVADRLRHVARFGPDEFDHEQRCVRKDGSVIWIQATGTIVRDAQGNATHSIASLYDATARRAEDDRLRETTRDAELASAAKDRFLAQLSHELRTPLTPALTAAAVLSMDDRLPEDVRGDLETIRRNIELEARLIDDLLDLNRAVSGKLKLRRETFELVKLLREAVAICAEDAAAKRIRVQLDVADNVGKVHADRTRLEQVAWNLLKNAVKFTPTGGRIDIRCTRHGDRVVLSVEDTGVGLEPELIGRIFGNFEQGNHANALNPGLGLGLAVARAIVELHGGTITAESDGPDTGSTFTVDLPVPEPVSDTGADNRSNEQVLQGRVLLIEDHADTAAVLGKFLRRSGFAVRLAHSLADARAALAEMAATGEHADLLLSDIDLPDGTAHDFIRETVDNEDRPRPIAVAFSGHGNEEDLRASRAAGFDEHLTKPIAPDELLATLRRLMKPRTAPAGSGTNTG
ncbi:MAG: PAS domain S-box protein [Planctomycetota bacterium]